MRVIVVKVHVVPDAQSADDASNQIKDTPDEGEFLDYEIALQGKLADIRKALRRAADAVFYEIR